MQNTAQKLESILGVKKTPSSQEKEWFKKTQDFVRLVRWIPGLRMIAVSNSLAMYATHPESDIDLFVITAPQRLWIVRTLLLGISTILWVRGKPGDNAGRFCFPFLMTEKNLNLRSLVIENDVYLPYWIRTLKPILSINSTYARCMNVNDWIGSISLEELEENQRFLIAESDQERQNTSYLITKILDGLESLLKKMFLPRILKQTNSLGNTEGIRITDDMLKLHYKDRRREIREKIQEIS